ncbi:MAG: gamma-glutamylcyclotransferase family protein [Candidatus Helarchaeales archaeon]
MPDIVGYGTFIISHVHGDKTFSVKGVCTVLEHKRVFHPFFENFQPFPYPFALPKAGHSFKALLFQVEPNDIPALDHYEGVPRLYTREKCQVKLENKVQTAEIYIPTKQTWSEFSERLDTIMTPFAYTKMNSRDLWLEFLDEKFPQIRKQYPNLFE